MRTVVIGGSVSGCAAALALSDLGHDVTLLDKDPGPLPADPDEAHRDWVRPGVPQSHHAHAFTSRGVNLLMDREPSIYAALIESGAKPMRLGESRPAPRGDGADEARERVRDDELNVLACRRRTFEMVLRRETARRPRITVHTGVAVQGLSVDAAASRVTGVRAGDAGTLPADVVIDATGRRSLSGGWLAKEGIPQPDDIVERSLITGYARFYRLLTDRSPGPPVLPGPLNRDNAAGAVWDGYAAFLHPADNNTFSLSFGVLPDDEPLRALRDASVFDAAAAAVGHFRPWLEPGVSEPISDVRIMPFADNTLRRAAVDPGEQRTYGLFRVGDAACVTNPLYGRGVSLALAHAYALADVLARHPVVGEEQSRAAATAADTHFRPWFEQAVRGDGERIAQWRRTVHATPLPESGSRGPSSAQLAVAATRDPVVWRHLARTQMSLPPTGASPSADELRRRVLDACDAIGPQSQPGPDRAQLLATIAAAAPALRLGYLGSPDAAHKVLAAATAAGYGQRVTVSESLVSEPYRALREREIDVLITRFRISEPDFAVGPVLYTEERVVAVATHHALASRTSVTSDDLAEHDVFQPPGSFPPDVYDQLVPRVSAGGRSIHRRCTADSMQEMFAAIADGRAIHPTIGSMRARDGHPGVVYVPVTDLEPAPVRLVRLADRPSPAVLSFTAAVSDGFADPTRAGSARETGGPT